MDGQRVYLAGTVILWEQALKDKRNRRTDITACLTPNFNSFRRQGRLVQDKRSSRSSRNGKTLTTSAKADITFPNVVSDLLMFAPSCNKRQTEYINCDK